MVGGTKNRNVRMRIIASGVCFLFVIETIVLNCNMKELMTTLLSNTKKIHYTTQYQCKGDGAKNSCIEHFGWDEKGIFLVFLKLTMDCIKVMEANECFSSLRVHLF